jgi:hypothetical protein
MKFSGSFHDKSRKLSPPPPPCGIGFQGFTWQAGGLCHDKRDACADGVDTKAMLAGPWVQSRDACADASRRWRLPGMGHQLWPSIGKQKNGCKFTAFLLHES